MYAVFESSHNPAVIPAHNIGEVATREAAEAFLEARGWSVICMEMDDEHDAADLAAARGSALGVFSVERLAPAK